MIGAIAGDIIGSIYEFDNIKTEAFPLFAPECTFTDDTVLTIALADSILTGESYVEKLKHYYIRYPDRGYGGMFHRWARSDVMQPYNSWGNGSAMRVSPVGFAYGDLDSVMDEAKKSAEVTHNHPEGIKGAQAIASAIFLARKGASKEEIRAHEVGAFEYDLSMSLEHLRAHYTFDVSCQGSVPQALIAFLASENYEDAIRKAVSIGGDTDTIACMVGGIAEAFYGGVPEQVKMQVKENLDGDLWEITQRFCACYCPT